MQNFQLVARLGRSQSCVPWQAVPQGKQPSKAHPTRVFKNQRNDPHALSQTVIERGKETKPWQNTSKPKLMLTRERPGTHRFPLGEPNWKPDTAFVGPTLSAIAAGQSFPDVGSKNRWIIAVTGTDAATSLRISTMARKLGSLDICDAGVRNGN